MLNISDVLKQLPEMKSGKELLNELAVHPKYDKDIVNRSIPERLMALSDIYRIYIPNHMSQEIYSKLYLSLIRSLQKKCTRNAIQQRYENHKLMRQQEYTGVVGGSDSFTIIGNSGIGKSSAISRAINFITDNRIIEVDKPYIKIIPCVVVQTPFDCSVKGLLLEILRKVDECLDSNYYQKALKVRATTDMIIGSVSQVAINHIGLLIVDEIQNVVNSKNGKALVSVLTQLINSSGISICMVGLNESKVFFEQGMQLARRSLGLQYDAMEYGAEFVELCNQLLQYQYVQHNVANTDAMIHWLYEHSSGNVSVVVSLIHDAQEIAILSGRERLDLEALDEAYQKRLALLHEFIQPTIIKKKQTSVRKKEVLEIPCVIADEPIYDNDITISELVAKAKEDNTDVVSVLREHITIEEVAL